MASFTPVEGTNPDKIWRVVGGRIVGGKAHAVADMDKPTRTSEVLGQPVLETACGIEIVAVTTYDPEAWPEMRDAPHKTHQTGVCSRCASKTKEA